MAKWKDSAKSLSRKWRSNLIVWGVAWISGSVLLTAIIQGIQSSVHHHPMVWHLLGGLFGVGVLLLIMAIIVQLWKRPVIASMQDSSRQSTEKVARGEAALLWHFSAQAKTLITTLEGVWCRWDNAGETLVYPLDVNHPRITDDTIDLIIELRDFRVLYADHLKYLGSEIPSFISEATLGGCPSKREYPTVLHDLKKHTESLEALAGDGTQLRVEAIWGANHE